LASTIKLEGAKGWKISWESKGMLTSQEIRPHEGIINHHDPEKKGLIKDLMSLMSWAVGGLPFDSHKNNPRWEALG